MQFDPPLEYDTIDVTAPTSLALVADITDTAAAGAGGTESGDAARAMVPAGYSLHVPKGSGSQLMAALQLIPPEHRDSWRMHRVATGETLATIGKRYGATPGSIVAANHLQSAEAVEGDRLLIPAVMRAPAPAARGASRAPRRAAALHARRALRTAPQNPGGLPRKTSASSRIEKKISG